MMCGPPSRGEHEDMRSGSETASISTVSDPHLSMIRRVLPRTPNGNVRDVIEPWDLPITTGLQESTRAFQRLEEEIELRPILESLAARPPLDATLILIVRLAGARSCWLVRHHGRAPAQAGTPADDWVPAGESRLSPCRTFISSSSASRGSEVLSTVPP
jgi:Domain of unknown function (DUF1931)